MAIYELIYLDGVVDGKNNPIGRFLIMQALESLGKKLFGRITPNFHSFHKETGLNLKYMSDMHSDLEQGTLHSDVVDDPNQLFAQVKITQKEYDSYLKVIYKVMDVIFGDGAHWTEKYDFVVRDWAVQNYYTNLY